MYIEFFALGPGCFFCTTLISTALQPVEGSNLCITGWSAGYITHSGFGSAALANADQWPATISHNEQVHPFPSVTRGASIPSASLYSKYNGCIKPRPVDHTGNRIQNIVTSVKYESRKGANCLHSIFSFTYEYLKTGIAVCGAGETGVKTNVWQVGNYEPNYLQP